VLLLIGFLLTSVTTAVHAVCTTLTLLLLESRWVAPRARRSMVTKGLVVMLVVNALFVASLLECGLWAAAYLWVDALGSWPEAYYFSATTFTTTGYGDVTLSPAWRPLGNFEAVIGILMFGWSTALLVTIVQHLRRRAEPEPQPTDGARAAQPT
jgi:voltage-gated potassium channel